MAKISDLKMGVRLGAAFGITVVFVMSITTIGVWRLQSMKDARNAQSAALEKVQLLKEWQGIIETGNTTMYAAIDAQDEEQQQQWSGKLIPIVEKASAISKQVQERLTLVREKAMLDDIRKKRAVFAQIRETILQIKKSKAPDSRERIRELVNTQMNPSSQAYLRAIHALVEQQLAASQEIDQQAEDIYLSGLRLLLVLGSLTALSGGVMAWLITRTIVHPVRNLKMAAEKLARGDMTSLHNKPSAKDELGQLTEEFRTMRASWRKIIEQVRQGADMVATASREISVGNLDLSSRTELQASSLEETAASMEQLTSTVKQNADNAKQANALAATASSVAVKGGNVVSKVVDTMAEINASSRKIVDIISVIDGIAFQTNILALNAAVEAARAGEQGRGFAVVATEVRSLAQRSAAAAKQIKELIDDSVNKVDVGTSLVGEAGLTMREIVESIQRVTAIMSDIASASTEQSAGIEQVNQAITEMDDVTQQNAALVEQASAATQALRSQAVTLTDIVSVFRFDGTTSIPSNPATG